MAEYIEKQAAIDALGKQPEVYSWEDALMREQWERDKAAIEAIPPADVRPVVRGHWIGTKEAENIGDIMKAFTCSVCGCCDWDCTESESFNFCPNCGADMRDIEDKEPVGKFEDWSDELKQTYRELLKKLHLIGGDAE